MPLDTTPTSIPPAIFDADPNDFLMPPGFDPSRTHSYLDLCASLDSQGQIVEILACEAGGDKYAVIDGLHRLCWAKERVRKVRTRLVDPPKDAVERDILIYTINDKRRRMPIEEKRDRLIAVMEKAPHWTQKQAAAALTMSETMASSLLSTGMIAADDLKRLNDAQVCASIICLIGPLRPPERMRQAVERAVTPRQDGKLPTKDEFILWLKRTNGKEKRGRKPGSLKGKHEGRAFQIGRHDHDDAAKVAEWLRSLAKRLEKHGGDMPPEGWNFLFN